MLSHSTIAPIDMAITISTAFFLWDIALETSMITTPVSMTISNTSFSVIIAMCNVVASLITMATTTTIILSIYYSGTSLMAVRIPLVLVSHFVDSD